MAVMLKNSMEDWVKGRATDDLRNDAPEEIKAGVDIVIRIQ